MDLNEEIQELPELLSREVGIQEKKLKHQETFDFCVICKDIVANETLDEHIKRKNHNRRSFKNSKMSNSRQHPLNEKNYFA